MNGGVDVSDIRSVEELDGGNGVRLGCAARAEK